MRFIRGVTGIVLFALVSCFIMLNVIFKPMQETALSPVKEYQTSVLPYGLADGIELPTWNIVFVRFSASYNVHLTSTLIKSTRYYHL